MSSPAHPNSFRALDDAGIQYCLFRHYDEPNPRDGSDVDFVVSREALPGQTARILGSAAKGSGGILVQAVDHDVAWSFVVAHGPSSFLRLDAWPAPDVGSFRFYQGEELLAGRRPDAEAFVPEAAIEFGCTLTRRIAKGELAAHHVERLAALHATDPAGCEREIARFWSRRTTRALVALARTRSWDDLPPRLPALRTELLRRKLLRTPLGTLRRLLARNVVRFRHLVRPTTGLHVVFLGPDGAGKSTVIGAMERVLGTAFSGVALCAGAPPSLKQLLDGTYKNRAIARTRERNGQPHGLPVHPLSLSLLKAVYWLFYYVIGYELTVRPALARGRLVVHHRYLVDALVDPERYRYGGPAWVLRLLCWASPKPDLVILLDAPPDVIRGRKRELPAAELERQVEAYRRLVRQLPNGHIIDTTQSPGGTVDDTVALLLRFMAERTARRFRVQS